MLIDLLILGSLLICIGFLTRIWYKLKSEEQRLVILKAKRNLERLWHQ